MSDTIAAIATARGEAALAIVRVSGPAAVSIVDSCFPTVSLEEKPSHTVYVGPFCPPGEHHTTIDRVVVTLFRAPRSATGEDVVEVSCHGGDFAPQLILKALLHAGATMAAPGEFTRRAFLNGKMDLAQAEAVADLIHASSTMAHRVSVQQMQGRYSDHLSGLREELLNTCAMVELELDFSEEEVEFADREQLMGLLDRARALLDELLNSYALGTKIRDGVRVVIGGRPNAGKSTLLNALLGVDRAIVSAQAGTTRDAIEAEAEIEGMRFRFVDTAGLRITDDAIEAEGVRRAHRSIEEADVLFYVYDIREGLHSEEATFLESIGTASPALPVLLIANKADLVSKQGSSSVIADGRIELSAQLALKEAHLLSPITAWLLASIGSGLRDIEASPVVVNQRHRHHLSRARDAVLAAQHSLNSYSGGDTLALDLRAALHELGQITGEITTEDILGQIFSRFCIGK